MTFPDSCSLRTNLTCLTYPDDEDKCSTCVATKYLNIDDECENIPVGCVLPVKSNESTFTCTYCN